VVGHQSAPPPSGSYQERIVLTINDTLGEPYMTANNCTCSMPHTTNTLRPTVVFDGAGPFVVRSYHQATEWR
jgi:hypothetical protein